MCYSCHPPVFFPAFIPTQASAPYYHLDSFRRFIRPAFAMPYECYVPTCILFSSIICSDITTHHWECWIYTVGTLPLGDIATWERCLLCVWCAHFWLSCMMSPSATWVYVASSRWELFQFYMAIQGVIPPYWRLTCLCCSKAHYCCAIGSLTLSFLFLPCLKTKGLMSLAPLPYYTHSPLSRFLQRVWWGFICLHCAFSCILWVWLPWGFLFIGKMSFFPISMN